jgi:hypothetical protein
LLWPHGSPGNRLAATGVWIDVLKALLVVSLVAIAAPAAASRITIGAPTNGTIDGAGLVLTTHTDHTHAVLTLTVGATSAEEVDVTTLLALPANSRVLGVALELPGERRVTASQVLVGTASESYDEIVKRRDDLALLLRHAQGGFALRVYPVHAERAARVSLLIEIPRAPTLELASAIAIGALEILIDDAPYSASTLDAPISLTLPAAQHTPHVVRMPKPLATTDAFFVGDGTVRAPNGMPFAQTRIELDMMSSEDIGEDNEIPPVELRKVVRMNLTSLASCFPAGSSTRGRIDLRFAVLPNGRPTAVSIEGPGSRSAKRCMSARVGQWRFSSREDVAMASFPLQARVIR